MAIRLRRTASCGNTLRGASGRVDRAQLLPKLGRLQRLRLLEHGVQLRELLVGNDVCVQLSCRRKKPLLERADGVVEGPDGSLEAVPDLVQVSTDDSDSLVELAAESLDLAGVLGDTLLLPPVGDRLQQDDQGRRRGDVYPRPDTALNERAILLPRGAEEALVREEHDHVVGAVSK